MSNTLIIIPARKGSKGLPNKNLKILNGKPLIQYTLEFAQKIAKEDDIICVSTDSSQVIELCSLLGINVDFKRPDNLATDKASMNDVLLHALDFYNNVSFEKILLLQPTSPFRKHEDYLNMIGILTEDNNIEQIASVKKVKDNPYFNMFKVKDEGYLEKLIDDDLVTNRQECPDLLALNGSMYLFRRIFFEEKKNLKFLKTKPYLMNNFNSCDIDDIDDFNYAEFLIQKMKEC